LDLWGDFIFDAVLYVVKIAADFYKVQYEYIKRDVGAVYMYLFQILWSMFPPKIG